MTEGSQRGQENELTIDELEQNAENVNTVFTPMQGYIPHSDTIKRGGSLTFLYKLQLCPVTLLGLSSMLSRTRI